MDLAYSNVVSTSCLTIGVRASTATSFVITPGRVTKADLTNQCFAIADAKRRRHRGSC